MDVKLPKSRIYNPISITNFYGVNYISLRIYQHKKNKKFDLPLSDERIDVDINTEVDWIVAEMFFKYRM